MKTATNHSENKKNIKKVVKEFLALPPEALPGAYSDDDDVSSNACWELLREIAQTGESAKAITGGARICMTADRPEWRPGIWIE